MVEGTYHDGKQRLLFSLRQIEYLQYYIHQTGLAVPERLDEIMETDKSDTPRHAGAALKETKPGDGFTEEGLQAESDPGWVPLPNTVILPSDLAHVVRFDFPV